MAQRVAVSTPTCPWKWALRIAVTFPVTGSFWAMDVNLEDGGAVLVGDGRRLWYASRDSKVVTHVLATQFRAFSVVALAKGYTGLDKLKHRR